MRRGGRPARLVAVGVTFGFLVTAKAIAGHQLFAPIIVASAGGGPRAGVVAVGIPISRLAAVDDAGALVVLGTDAWRVRPLSRWPDGHLQWVLVEASVEVAAGAVTRLYLTTGALGPHVEPTGHPAPGLVGKAELSATYDDSWVLPEPIGRAPADPTIARQPIGPAEPPSWPAVDRLLRAFLAGPSIHPELFARAREHVTNLGTRPDDWRESTTVGLPGATLGIWYGLTGEEDVRAIYLAWGERLLADEVAMASDGAADATVLQLVNLWTMSGDARFRDAAWRWFELHPIDARSASLFLRDGGLPPDRTDLLLDHLDGRVAAVGDRFSPLDPLEAGHLLVHAYRNGGDDRVLRRAAELLAEWTARGDGSLAARAVVTDLIERSDRQEIWRPLDLVTEATADGYVITWTTPANALGFRLKRLTSTALPFHLGTNLQGEPDAGEAGGTQQMRIARAPGDQASFAGRYLAASLFVQRERRRVVAAGGFTFAPLDAAPVTPTPSPEVDQRRRARTAERPPAPSSPWLWLALGALAMALPAATLPRRG